MLSPRLLLLCTTIGLLLATAPAHAQLRVSPLAPKAVPASLHHTGRVVQAVHYTDSTGTYTVLATQAGPVTDDDIVGDGSRADLYAYQYRQPATGAPVLSWQVHDFVADCPVDIGADFVPKGLSVTDLDHNGVAEVWLVYRTICRGDVSPSNQKIIMYEGSRKYAVRGTTQILIDKKPYSDGDDGKYTLDAALKAAPAAIRQYAVKLWQQHRIEALN